MERKRQPKINLLMTQSMPRRALQLTVRFDIKRTRQEHLACMAAEQILKIPHTNSRWPNDPNPHSF
jgi:hypothetical protein